MKMSSWRNRYIKICRHTHINPWKPPILTWCKISSWHVLKRSKSLELSVFHNKITKTIYSTSYIVYNYYKVSLFSKKINLKMYHILGSHSCLYFHLNEEHIIAAPKLLTISYVLVIALNILNTVSFNPNNNREIVEM